MPAQRTCTSDDCTAPVLARGMCRRHYSAWHYAQDHGPCPVDGCDGRRRSRGTLCPRHESRLRDTGDPETPLVRPRRMTAEVCAAEGCEKHPVAKSLCDVHYWRQRTHGSLDTPPGRERRARWRTNAQGYVFKYWPEHPCANRGGRVLEHHVVMCELLGRTLREGETVHHRNGIRSDNRPENLELWASRHPKGQRVEDLVAFAREILAEYGDEATR